MHAPRPAGQHDDQVGQEHRFVEVVRDEDDGLAGACPELQHGLLHDPLGLHVEGPERFVHQQHVRRIRVRAREVDALPHSPGEFLRIGLAEFGQSHRLAPVRDQSLAFGLGDATGPRSVLDVLFDGQPGEDGVPLEDKSQLVVDAADRLAIVQYLALGRRQQAGHYPQQRRLAATGFADDADKLPVFDRKVDVFEYSERLGRRTDWEAVREPVHAELHGCARARGFCIGDAGAAHCTRLRLRSIGSSRVLPESLSGRAKRRASR